MSSATCCNCSFTMECLKNSLQILCIYAELFNSAVCCSLWGFFLVLVVFPLAARALPLRHIHLPALPSWRCRPLPPAPRAVKPKGRAELPCPVIYASLPKRRWGSPAGRALPAVNPNPVPFCQKTPNAQNWHLICSPGCVGLYDNSS